MFSSNGNVSSANTRISNRQSLIDEEDLGPSMPGAVYIRIHIPDNNSQKCLQFYLNESIFRAKQQVISLMGHDLNDPLNYGLFWPPNNGRSGKFLQEERLLKDYPLQGPIGLLEFKYKRRNYDGVSISSNKLKKLHTKNNLKQFLEVVKSNDVPKVYKWITKGIDPNFHCKDSGETPLTIASQREKPRELIMALTNGGAHFDFRARDSMTPLHKAAICGNLDAIRTLLDLGQNPNSYDNAGLTPLFYTLRYDTSPHCTEALLYDHSIIGVSDEKGLQEIHEACRYGRIQHLEHLITYGADLDALTKNGNTPLHICALTGNEECTRLLLFRGARRDIENNSGETSQQLAMMNRRMDIAELIGNFRDEDIVRLKSSPKLNRNRRASAPGLHPNNRCASLNQLPAADQQSSENGSVNAQTQAYSSSNVRAAQQSPIRVSRQGESSSLSGSSSRGSKSINKNGTSRSVTDLNVYDSALSDSLGNSSVTNLRSSQYSNYARSPLIPMLSGEMVNFPRSIVLQKGSSGFGFVLRGSKNEDANIADFMPTAEVPALQYFESIQTGSPADKAGLKKGDYVLEINSVQCLNYSHDQVVNLIREAGDTLAMKVMTVDKEKLQQQNQVLDQLDQTIREYDDVTSLKSFYSSQTKPMPVSNSCQDDAEPEVYPIMSGTGALVSLTENQIKRKLRENALSSSNHQTHQDDEHEDAPETERQLEEIRAFSQPVVQASPPVLHAPPSTPNALSSPVQSKSKRTAPPPPIRTISQASSQPVIPNKTGAVVNNDIAPTNTDNLIYANNNSVNFPPPSNETHGDLSHANLPRPPSSMISDSSSIESANQLIDIPPPDYMDSSDEETKTVSHLQSIIQAEVNKRNSTHKQSSSRPQSTVSQIPPPPPVESITTTIAAAVPPPPPPPPPPPVPPSVGIKTGSVIPKKVPSDEQKPKNNGPPVQPKPLSKQQSHDDHLKHILAIRKQKLEESPGYQEAIVEKVNTNKHQTKSYVFSPNNSRTNKTPPLSAPAVTESGLNREESKATNGPLVVAPNKMFFPAQNTADKPVSNGSVQNFKAQAEQLRQQALRRQNQQGSDATSIQSEKL